MARTPKPFEPLDYAVVKVIKAMAFRLGLSQRQISDRAGMSLNRIGIILRDDGPPATVGEIDRIAGVLGVEASAIFAEAEQVRKRDAVPGPARDNFTLIANPRDPLKEQEAYETDQ